MVKGVALIKRKPGLSPEEFRKHYEEVHAPLIRKSFPSLKRYARNFVNAAPFSRGAGEPEFDCITEMWFDDMQGFQAMVDAWGGEAGRAIANDERRFLDRTKTVYLIVEEVVSK